MRSAGDREIAPCRENVSCVYIVGKGFFHELYTTRRLEYKAWTLRQKEDHLAFSLMSRILAEGLFYTGLCFGCQGLEILLKANTRCQASELLTNDDLTGSRPIQRSSPQAV